MLPFKPGQLNNWQILTVHNGVFELFILGVLKELKAKTNWTILKKNLRKLYRFSCQKGQIRIRAIILDPDATLDQKGPGPEWIHNTGSEA
jgi:hypothetical protein